MSAEIRIGTSGYHYKHWLGPYYPADMKAAGMLPFYVRDFDSVEINNSFYRLPSRAAFENWRDETPSGFLFAVKGSRYVTHMKKLKDPEAGINLLLERAEGLGDKLGPILFQLPPRWHVDTGRLAAFLDALPDRHRYSFEFRDRSWHTPEVFDLLRQHNVALCMYHLCQYQSPMELTADWAYIRLHGPGDGAYQGDYADEGLQYWVDRIREWRDSLRAIYIYFDNDEAGYAAKNAKRLREMVGAI